MAKRVMLVLSLVLFNLAACDKKIDPPQPVLPTATQASVAPVEAGASVPACVESLIQTKLKIAAWEDGLKKHCLSLSDQEQEQAAEIASDKVGKRIAFWKPSDVIGEFAKGSLPYGIVANGEQEEEWLAKQGNYQAQRNYAYAFRESGKNPVAACAWRIVIMSLGSPRINEGDRSNLELECGRLSQAEALAAKNQSDMLLAEIKQNMQTP